MRQRRSLLELLIIVLLGALLLAGIGCAGDKTAEIKDKGKSKAAPLSPQAVEHLTQGQKFLHDTKLDESLKEIQEAVRLAPDSPVAYFWLGRVYFYTKDKEQAEKAFKKVLELDPENYHAMAWLGKLYSFDKDKLTQAQSYLQKALQESPENLEAHFDLARLYAMQGDRDKALREFNFLFGKERDFFIYHFELGRMFEAWNEKDKALEQYKRALVLSPNFGAAEEAIKRLEEKRANNAAEKSPVDKPAPPKK